MAVGFSKEIASIYQSCKISGGRRGGKVLVEANSKEGRDNEEETGTSVFL